MIKKVLAVLVVFMCFSSFVLARDLNIPKELMAKVFVIRSERDGFWEKSLVILFPERRRVLSTNSGFVDVLAVVNHSAHPELWKEVCQEMKTDHEVGGKVYMRKVQERIAKELGLKSQDITLIATAVDMDNLTIVVKVYSPFVVAALVTAGAKTNALRTGLDEGKYVEGREPKGTVNIILLTNARLTDGAMARAIITITEAKTAAFEDLKVPSSYTRNVQATGTGTDSVIIVSGNTGPEVTYTGGHSKIGELIGKAVYEAVIEALEKQNGFKKK
ncbi:MAG: adenosylcobinamide amidohydrolase [Thermosulfidibacteraceae bacterium]|jgi:adenosylcobinamide amidohydrolase